MVCLMIYCLSCTKIENPQKENSQMRYIVKKTAQSVLLTSEWDAAEWEKANILELLRRA